MKKTIALDLDGTLASYKEGWKGVDVFGDPIPGSVLFTELLSKDYNVLIYTCRCNPELGKGEGTNLLRQRVKEYLDLHGFHYDEIYIGVGKPIASAYVDDKSIACTPEASKDPLETYARTLIDIKNLIERK